MKHYFSELQNLKGTVIMDSIKEFLVDFLSTWKNTECMKGITPLNFFENVDETFSYSLLGKDHETIFSKEKTFVLEFYFQGIFSSHMFLQLGPINPMEFYKYFHVQISLDPLEPEGRGHQGLEENAVDFQKLISQMITKKLIIHD